MNISFIIPHEPSGDIGKCYNYEMNKLVNDDDFACFIDSDAMFTTYGFYDQIAAIIEKYPECGLFVAVANRIGCLWQRAGDWNSDDIRFHRQFGKDLAEEFGTAIEDKTDMGMPEPLGGFLILIKKSTWKKIGGFKEIGQLGVDNDIHRKALKAGEKVYLIPGLYIFHWYRGGDQFDKSHIKNRNK